MSRFAIVNAYGVEFKVEEQRLCRVVDVDDYLGLEFDVLTFDREIHWFRETYAQATVYNKRGNQIAVGGNYSDYYGFLTSVEQAMKEADTFVEEYEGMRVEVVVSIMTTPYLLASEEAIERSITKWSRVAGKSYYIAVPGDWALNDGQVILRLTALQSQDFEKMIDRANHLNYLVNANPEQKVKVFSSDRTAAENAKVLESLNQYRV
jgi:hypothetical protein